jgi:hypothetical protein
MRPTPANMLTPEYLRWLAMAHGTGPDKPSFSDHPLHSEFVALVTDARSLLTAAVEASLQRDGSVASAAYAIRMRMFSEIMTHRCNGLASALLSKAKRS